LSSFITTHATQDVFELVLARPVVAAAGEHPWLVHLWWRAPLQDDRLVQVYVQGELYDVTLDPALREMCLVLDRTQQSRIELLAIPANDPQAVWRPQPGLLGAWQPSVSSSARVDLVRDERLPVDTQLVVEIDGQKTDRGAMWPQDQNRSVTDGLLAFGDVAGVGLGVGDLGMGALGAGGTAWRWRRDVPSIGSHDVTINAVDLAGMPVADPILIQDVLIDSLPNSVTDLAINPSFGLSWVPASTDP
jgi:hypothetical protein